MEAFTCLHNNNCQQQHQRRHHRNVRPIRVIGRGWDNDNFLNSLSGNDKDREDADDKYFQMSRFGKQQRNNDEEFNDDDDDDMASDNDKDNDLSNSIAGAQLTADMIDKIKNSHTPDEEASGGGKMFREMLNRAKERQPPQPRVDQQPPPPYYAPPPPLTTMPLDPNRLSVEEQARMFREMMMMQQQTTTGGAFPAPSASVAYAPPLQQPPPTPPANYLQAGVDSTGRRVGRNRDADAIVNSADVYFTQLKRDSSLRNIARHAGDDEKANAVFADPSIQNIKLHVNPYLEEQKAKEKQLLETSPDEMLLPFLFKEESPAKPKSYSGVSYRDKLQQKKSNNVSGGMAAPVQQNPPRTQFTTPEQREVPVQPIVATPTTRAAAQNVNDVYNKQVAEPVLENRSTSMPQSKPPATTGSSNDASEEENTRKDIRTFMGLLLKHRGGPGFGSGRLQGGEAKKFEALADELSELLRQEAKQQFPLKNGKEGFGNTQDQSVKASQTPLPTTTTSTAAATPRRPPPESLSLGGGGAVERSLAAGRPQPSIATLLTCIEGAIQMFRNSPPELHDSVLGTLRVALLSAISACDISIVDNERKNLEAFRVAVSDPRTRDNRPGRQSSTSGGGGGNGGGGGALSSYSLSASSYQQSPTSNPYPATPRPERINGLLSCVEGAILMYRNSPPELLEGVLITLRAALFTAAKTCNSILSENQNGDDDDYGGGVFHNSMSSNPTTRTTPTHFYDVVPEVEQQAAEGVPPSPTTTTTDENSEFLQQVWDKLAAAAGTGKMGLREDLSADEATDLVDAIATMRSILIEELENDDSSTTTADSVRQDDSQSPPRPSAFSKYDEMLAKARADKTTKL